MILICFGLVSYQILSYIITSNQAIIKMTYQNTISFRLEDKPGAYKRIYEIAFLGNERVENKKGIYLSRIPKKNGKSRYYLTQEDCKSYCRGCDMEGCSSHSCRGGYYYEYTYTSKYIGNELDTALNSLAKCDSIVGKVSRSHSTEDHHPLLVQYSSQIQFNEQKEEYKEW